MSERLGRPTLLLGALLLLLAGVLSLKDRLIAPPEVRPAAEGGFDTGRAVARLERILGGQRPHPVDSQENDAVRERLIAELRRIGLTPRVTDDVVCGCSAKSRTVSCARVRNVLATIGPAEGRHLLLVSHYDSVPAGPGAADDGIGVAVMLETAAQLARRPPARPVTFLFDEGEEAGLLGAHAFLRSDPLAERVDTLLNFESRGVEGPAIMFETDRPNGTAIGLYARAVERPVANSLATDFYRLIPNSTDVAVFEKGGWTTLNFAVIGNETRYHSPGDTLAALDRRSVQHMGDQALALASEIAAGGTRRSQGSANYVDLLGRGLIVIPTPAALAALAALALGAALVAWRRRRGLGRAVGAVSAAILGGTALSYLAQGAVKLGRGGDYWRAYPIVTDLAVYVSVLLAATAALLLAARGAPADRLRAAFWLVFLVVGSALAAAVPGAAIFFLVPGAFAVGGMLLGRFSALAERLCGVAAALTLFLLWAPLLALMALLLRHGEAWLFAPVAAALVLPWLIEARPLTAGARTKAALVPLAAATVLAWTALALAPAYSGDRKQAFGIEYAWHAATAEGRWLIANDGAPLPAAYRPIGRFEPDAKVPWSSRKRWVAPAPPGLAVAPGVELLSQHRTGAGRAVSLRIAANGAETITLRGPPQAEVRAVRAGGSERPMGGRDRKGKETDGSDDYIVRCHGRSCDGLRLDLLVGSPGPVEWTVVGVSRGLSAAARPLVQARPANAAPQYMPDSTIGLSRLRF
jgi:hypothetical protein